MSTAYNTDVYHNTRSLQQYFPSRNIVAIMNSKHKKIVEKLRAINPKFGDYYANNCTLTPNNMCEVFHLLLDLSDIYDMQQYMKLTLRGKDLTKDQLENSDYIVKFHKALPLYPTCYDEVIIIPVSAVSAQNIASRSADLWEYYLASAVNIGDCYTGHVISDRNTCDGVVKFVARSLPKEVAKHCYVLFRSSRMLMRYKHLAVDTLKATSNDIFERFLFPKVAAPIGPLQQLSNTSYATLDGLNKEQSLAVTKIVNGAGNKAPYIIYGPPGTGKSTVIARTIMQLRNKQAKILVMAATNAACDAIAARILCELKKIDAVKSNNKTNNQREILRIYAEKMKTPEQDIDEDLLNISNKKRGQCSYPSVETIHEYRIVVCTLSTAGRLSLGDFGLRDKKHSKFAYTHIFIDETQTASEIESLMGLMCSINSNAQLILAGDDKQLRPFISSGRAKALGIGIPLMCRLQKLPGYAVNKEGNYNTDVVVHLRFNYRAHPKIMALYGHVFYGDKLCSMAPNAAISLAVGWNKLQDSSFPVLAHNVVGQENIHPFSRSFYNDKEVEVVLEYLWDLLSNGIDGDPIKRKDVAIISPYRQQCRQIKREMRKRPKGVMCGTAEILQGQEYQIIIISFVRTKQIGFINDKNRLNAMISRARSLLILIGDLATLEDEPHLAMIFKKCYEHGNVCGKEYIPRD